ncbi:MAG: cardiolipin synthase [Deltaproteobacteria bacterium]|nr:cardiolipin synthase [Deltaproteobacteria bacterium]
MFREWAFVGHEWELVLGHVLLVAGFLFAAALVGHIIRQRRSPSGTIAWLLVIVLMPYVGVPLYVMFGGRKMRKEAHKKARIKLKDHAGPQSLPNESIQLDRLLQTYGLPRATEGNNLQLCQDGEEVFKRLKTLIEGARESVSVATFILGRGPVGREVLALLTKAAARGVRVRLLLDDLGNLHLPKLLLRPLKAAGGEVAFFMPVLHLPFRGQANLRNHRKIVVVDEETVLAGGTNLAEEYIGPQPIAHRWKDLSFVLSGPAVRHYTEIFRLDWMFAGGSNFDLRNPDHSAIDAGQAVVQVVPSGPDVDGDPFYDAVLSSIFSARERFWVVTPYFVPDDPLAQAMRLAAHRGVDVRLIVPERSNHFLADVARSTYMREIQEAGARVMAYTPGMLHAKVVIQDEAVAQVGSANMDMRSLFLNYEAMLLVYSREEVLAVEEWVKTQVLAHCRPLEPREAGPAREMAEGLVRMVAPLL